MIDNGDTAWVMTATALVFLMSPAVGLLYAGLIRSKNTLNTFMMVVASVAIALVTWAVVGYSLAFDGGAGGFVGGFDNAFLNGVSLEPLEGQTIPEVVFFAFQATFVALTTALVSGAVVERMRFGAFMVFAALWSVLVYAVMAHWGFGGGWLTELGTLDFAGGVPVEMASGFSALAAALVVGARKDYGRQAILPHNTVLVLLGAGLLWFGWFGFNGGSGLGINDAGALAFVNTLLTPATALLMWFILDYWRGRKITAVGAATAIIVGCVAITPAGPFISPGWAMLLGALAVIPCWSFIVWRTRKTKIDETADVLAAHGIAGLFGMLYIGFFAEAVWGGTDGFFYGNPDLLLYQFVATLAAPAYAFVVTYILLRVIGLVMPLRATEKEEALGLDVVEHGEEAYVSGEGAILVTDDRDGRLEEVASR